MVFMRTQAPGVFQSPWQWVRICTWANGCLSLLTYVSGVMRQPVGEKEAGTPGPGNPTTFRKNGIQSGGGLFLQRVASDITPEGREDAAGGGRRQRSGVHHKPCVMGSCLLQPIPHHSCHVTQRPKFKPPALEQ